MSELEELKKLENAIYETEKEFFQLDGERKTLLKRKEFLEDTVGKAKFRLEKKDEVEEFLEILQFRAHERSVGVYEKLLTALASDVVPHTGKISLDLSTKRGLPSLDIKIDKGDNKLENIIGGQGGSIANVLSTGLRFIAIARSGQRKFLLLDEPDCWVSNERVKAFISVIVKTAKELGFQILLITHHNSNMGYFADDVMTNYMYLENPKDKIYNTLVEEDPRIKDEHLNNKDENYIKGIKLNNFMTYKDVYIPLSKGVTAISGDNNIGKSVITYALRALAYGEIDDTNIRHYESACSVSIEMSSGKIVELSRQKKRNPVNLWTLFDENGQAVVETGGSGKDGMPDWVKTETGLTLIDKMEIQLGVQTKPVFLLDETGQKKASILSVGKESEYIALMIKKYKDEVTEDRRTVKKGEEEVGEILLRLEELKSIDEGIEEINELKNSFFAFKETNKENEYIGTLINRYERITNNIKEAEEKLKIYEYLPSEVPELIDNSKIIEIGKKLSTTSKAIKQLEDNLKLYDELPSEVPELIDNSPYFRYITEYNKLSSKIKELEGNLKIYNELPNSIPELIDNSIILSIIEKHNKLNESISKLSILEKEKEEELIKQKHKIDKLLSENESHCPVCNSIVNSEHLLGENI